MQYGIFYLSPVYRYTYCTWSNESTGIGEHCVNIVCTIHKRGRWDNTTLVPVFVKKVTDLSVLNVQLRYIPVPVSGVVQTVSTYR